MIARQKGTLKGPVHMLQRRVICAGVIKFYVLLCILLRELRITGELTIYADSGVAFSWRNFRIRKTNPTCWTLHINVGWRILRAILPWRMRNRPSYHCGLILRYPRIRSCRWPCGRPPTNPWASTKIYKKALSSAAIICHHMNQAVSNIRI